MTTESVESIITRVGDPFERRDILLDHVQTGAVKSFADVEEDWLALMWSLDAFRVANVPPPGARVKTLEALNKKKGDWFAELVAALLQNWTSQPLGARYKVEGFSQYHQIDVAWPERKQDPLVCIESKVMGAPATSTTKARAARDDWSNRRKEVKFAATDLKLYRRQQETSIRHWDQWRTNAPPATYFVLAARLEPGRDDVGRVVQELRSLVDTYVDGAGAIAWEPSPTEDGYQIVPVPKADKKHALDDVLHRIASEIKSTLDPEGRPPEPVVPE